jgi:hypothetical protein
MEPSQNGIDKDNKQNIITISSDLDKDLIAMYFITRKHKQQEDNLDLIWLLATLLSTIQAILIIISPMGIIEKTITVILGGIIWFLYTYIVDHKIEPTYK